MSYNKHDLGDSVKVYTGTDGFTVAATGSALDPDVVKLSIRTPAGVVTTYTYGDGATIVKDAVGKYHAIIDANETGTWRYRWFSTGDGQAAEENRFEVREAEAI